MNLSLLDWSIIAAYMIAMLLIGLWAMQRVKDAGGFLLGKRKMGKWLMIASSFGTGVSSSHPISVASHSYAMGFSGVWISLGYLFATPFYWLFPPVFRRLRMVTMVDFFRLRYGREMEVLYNAINLLHGIILIGLGIKTAGVVLAAMTAGGIGEFWGQLIIVAIVLAYAIPGGILAAYATDLIQGLLIVVLSFVIIPFAAHKVGGFAGLHDKVPEKFFELVSATGVDGAWIFWFAFGGLVAMSANPIMASYGAARNEMSARMTVFGTLTKRVCTIGWMLTGVFAIAFYGASAIDADHVFAKMSADLLPVGLRGVMVASIFAAVMSTVSAQMIFAVSILTNNIYQEFLVKRATPRHYLAFARISGAGLVLLGWAAATQFGGLVKMVLLLEQFSALAGVSVLGAIVWRGSTRWGALASVAVMAPLFYYGSVYKSWPLAVWAPLFLIPGIVTFVIVSLLTRQHNQKHVDGFYLRLETPLGEEHRLREAGVEVDLLEHLDGKSVEVEAKDHDISKRLWLADFLTWPVKIAKGECRLSDYKVDMLGFLALWVFAGLFIGGVYALARLGS